MNKSEAYNILTQAISDIHDDTNDTEYCEELQDALNYLHNNCEE